VEGNEMSQARNARPKKLAWDVSHLRDEDFDAEIVKFKGWENAVGLLPSTEYSLPDEVLFEANFNTLDKSDFPYNNMSWPILSQRMLDCLLEVGSISHRAIDVTMIDDRVPTKARYDPDGRLKPSVIRREFKAIKLLELLAVFDPDRSDYAKAESPPGFAFGIRKWVLKTPSSGFPPLFRVSASPADFFISHAAEEALRRIGARGIEIQDVVELSS
jgi:hypothetical protein